MCAVGRWVSPIALAPGVGDPIRLAPGTCVVAAECSLAQAPRFWLFSWL